MWCICINKKDMDCVVFVHGSKRCRICGVCEWANKTRNVRCMCIGKQDMECEEFVYGPTGH